MAMDVCRTGSKLNAWVGADNDTQVEIRWYKCAEGAKVFPAFHAFGHPMWEPHPDEWIRGPGVDTLPFEWAPSVIPAPAGDDYHGPLEWYQKGIPQAVLDDPEPFEREPCQPVIVPDVFTIRCDPVSVAPDQATVRFEVQDFTF